MTSNRAQRHASKGFGVAILVATCVAMIPLRVTGQDSVGTPPARSSLPAASQPAASKLPEGPTKALVLAQCNICHDLAWIENSGGTVQGWTSRLKRMRRSGCTLPPEKFKEVAEYLAAALPERPAPLPKQTSR